MNRRVTKAMLREQLDEMIGWQRREFRAVTFLAALKLRDDPEFTHVDRYVFPCLPNEVGHIGGVRFILHGKVA